jgi:hypothetical protein
MYMVWGLQLAREYSWWKEFLLPIANQLYA